MINTTPGEHQASFEVVRVQVGHFRQNLRRIKARGEQVENVADTNSHPAHARPPSTLPGIHGDSFHQFIHISTATMRPVEGKVKGQLPEIGARPSQRVIPDRA